MHAVCKCTHAHAHTRGHNFKITYCGDQNRAIGFVLVKGPSSITQSHSLSSNIIIILGPQFIIYTYLQLRSNYNTSILHNNPTSLPYITSEQHQMREKKIAELYHKFEESKY